MAKKWTEEQKEASRIAYATRMKTKEPKVEVEIEGPIVVPQAPSINNDVIQNLKDQDTLPQRTNGMQMDQEGLFQSMRNIIMILPPNLAINGRHTIENISALCGYKVTEDQWNKLYEEKEAA